MKITVFGLGYVGCVVSACMAKDGHDVTGIDPDAAKVDAINRGQSPIVEPELGEVIAEAVRSGRIRALTSAKEIGDVSFVSVGTPSNGNGSFGASQILRVAAQIGELIAKTDQFHVVTIRSTVLPGTVEGKIIPLLESSSGKKLGEGFGVCVNPEFMRETTAVYDYYHPPMTVIGSTDERSGALVASLYDRVDAPLEHCRIRTAEMMKYACNAFHAVKITFANEIGNFCKALGIDSHEVMNIFCQDRKLNLSPYYLKPGFAFGGSCLPKDLRALLYESKLRDVEIPMLNSLLESNRLQVARAIDQVTKTGKNRIGVLGLSFKAGTDDLRESPIVSLIESLIGKGYAISIYDEEVSLARIRGANKRYIEHSIPHIASLLRERIQDVIEESEVLVVAKKGKSFEENVAGLNHGSVVIDLVRIFSDRSRQPVNYEGICW
ncbi:MAG: UDP-glucose/GDP-mannose dehydrogenase family protein [Verrucomicrobia bacterium]|nr:UDP-glucose/GDP-mannose dehydrogenase family protein [Verrucomicrobiota bacterium]